MGPRPPGPGTGTNKLEVSCADAFMCRHFAVRAQKDNLLLGGLSYPVLVQDHTYGTMMMALKPGTEPASTGCGDPDVELLSNSVFLPIYQYFWIQYNRQRQFDSM